MAFTNTVCNWPLFDDNYERTDSDGLDTVIEAVRCTHWEKQQSISGEFRGEDVQKNTWILIIEEG